MKPLSEVADTRVPRNKKPQVINPAFVHSLLKKPTVLSVVARAGSSLEEDIEAGIMVPSVSCGGRSRAWVRNEIEAVVAARVAGKDEDYIKSLVRWLVAQREETAAALLPPDEELRAKSLNATPRKLGRTVGESDA